MAVGNLDLPVMNPVRGVRIGIAEAAMQQHYWRAAAEARVPDAGAVDIDEATVGGGRQGRKAMGFEVGEVVVGEGHGGLQFAASRSGAARIDSQNATSPRASIARARG